MAELVLSSAQVNRTALTPMMLHYIEMKEQYPHAVMLYRLGDFFEAFFEDAELISRELELVLTGRDGGKAIGRIAMAGIPHHALDRYANQLVEKGYSIAVCDQMEAASEAQGLVRREVTRVITPGTVIEEGMLAVKQNNFLVAIANGGENWGLAYTDISTGEFSVTQLNSTEHLIQELLRLQPAEVLIPIDVPNPQLFRGSRSDKPSVFWEGIAPKEKSALPEPYSALPDSFCYTPRSQAPFALAEAKQRILDTFRVRSLEGFGCQSLPLAIRAAGGILEYLESTQKSIKMPLQGISTYVIADYLILDNQTRRNLEITQTVRDGTFYSSLLWALDKTTTGMGSRALRRWLLQPLKDIEAINERLDTIAELYKQHSLRKNLRSCLSQIYDIERLCSRIGAGTANGRDLIAVAMSLEKMRDVADVVARANSRYLKALQSVPSVLLQLGEQLQKTLVEEPPIYITEGNIIRSGVNEQLDRLRQQSRDDVEWLSAFEKQEKERTGINTLKVGFNKAFGYYISISRGKSEQAPTDYIRKQTLTNEERYITPELKERETRILNADSELKQLEYDLFVELRLLAAQQIEPMRTLATALAAADVLCSLAEVAVTYNYCRPQITNDRAIAIHNGRHPVVEQSLPAGFFIPNSTYLGNDRQSVCPDLIVLTGPNMSGKSIYLRQVGLIQLMAQVGSFVPAEAATLGICDRIFTRVGAVDDLATGQSTFMVEMNETANILNHAKEHSLVLLDEIGRGTSTFDGMAIAWSVAEYIANKIKARGIFATHYHELNELASLLPNVANFQVTVKELEDEIIFLHQVQEGGADRSYGIEVGRLAGLPATVISRAKEVLEQIAKNSHIATGLRKGGSQHRDHSPKSPSKTTKKSSNDFPDDSQMTIFDTNAP
ncbi:MULTISPECIES: DNA mismatch repair protein MutS [Pseudanabaena]|uniref:DNA mismatch repair protein MutS n=2 Tax=Pseudanabaena TaxID=1152 RepID=L8N1R2_9CYAN|nr:MULTISPECIES: DNA mismatch repair protein MutS [Pseudanabaena]ELS33019.1 DNA mismatch repair protein MutS [Pseudanabaena biceps PCC 7429]MDG3494742.1 DNA mismatch repair protein MutS [Pseudanabaena catenata USMAC16]